MIDNYNDLTIDKYLELMNLLDDNMEDLTLQVSMISILSDEDEDDILNLPLSEYKKRVGKTAFLMEEPKKRAVAPQYKVGGVVLETVMDLKSMTAGQYIDYQTFVKDPQKYIVELLSVFLIPKGKKYNDGYDIIEIQNLIRTNISIVDALSLSAFFLNLSQSLIKATLTYLISKLKKMRKKMKNQEEVLKMEQAIQNLENVGDGLVSLTK